MRRNAGSGDCPTIGYVVLNLKIRTNRLVHDGRKLRSPWGRSPEQYVQGAVRAVATAFSGQPHESPSLHRFGLGR